MKSTLKQCFATITLGIVLVSCGGGGSGGDTTEPPAQVDNTPISTLEKRKAIAKIVSVLRFYHPSEEAMSADWDRLTTHALRLADSAQTRGQFLKVLSDSFHPVAPTMALNGVRLKPKAAATGERVAIHFSGGFVADNYESCLADLGVPVDENEPYWRERLVAKTTTPQYFPASEEFTTRIDGGIDVSIPLVLPALNGNALPDGSALPAGVASETLEVSNPHAVMAGFITVWAGMRNFFPYWQDVNIDPEQTLEAAVTPAALPVSRREYYLQLLAWLSVFQDAHIRITPNYAPLPPPGLMPLRSEWIDSKMVITDLAPSYAGRANVGDVITHIGDKPVRGWLDDMARFWSLAPDKKDIYGGRYWVYLEPGVANPVQFTTEDRNGTRSTHRIGHNELINASAESQRQWDALKPGVQMMQPGIFLVRFPKGESAESLRAQIHGEKAVILDMRSLYEFDAAFEFMRYLNTESAKSQIYRIHHSAHPWQQHIEIERADWTESPLSPAITAPTYILMNRHTQSAGETLLNMAKGNGHIKLLGEATHGANGNISCMQIWGGVRRGGLSVVYTGLHVANRDGSKHHAVGTLPDIEVRQTLAGVRAGKDEVLEKAIELARQAQ